MKGDNQDPEDPDDQAGVSEHDQEISSDEGATSSEETECFCRQLEVTFMVTLPRHRWFLPVRD